MEILLYILIGFAAIIFTFAVIISIRTLRFKPLPLPTEDSDNIEFDFQRATENFAQLIRCKTVSRYQRCDEDDAEFEKLYALLPKLYPGVHRTCELKKFPDRGLLYKWSGRNHGSPTVLMAHYDVVPANGELWDKPPFEATIEGGVMWGRGTLDTKVTFSGILFAAEHLINEGYVPENDIYFAFSGGEEVAGDGALHIVNYFDEIGITPKMVLDEGGAVVEGAFPGLSLPCAYIGIAEKGMMDVEYRVKSNGGHASAPKPHTPVGTLSRACCKVEKKPFKYQLTKPVSEMFNTLGRYSSLPYRIIFSNMWCFGWIIDKLGSKNGGDINALIRTTVAFTQMKGSEASNVIPPEAVMVSNLRLNPHDSMENTLGYLKNTVNDGNVELTILRGYEPSRISDTSADGYLNIVKAITATWHGCIPTPYLMVQCSDSRHWGKLSDKVYRFSAMDLTAEERASIHGNNEKIRLECYKRTCEFFIRLMKSC